MTKESPNRIALLENRCHFLQSELHAANFREAKLRTTIRDLIFQMPDQNSAPAEDGITVDVDKVIDHLDKHLVRGKKLGDLGDAVDKAKRGEKASGAIGKTNHQHPHGSF